MKNAGKVQNMHKVTIHTDGACKGNPGVGGWGALLESGKHVKELYGGEKNTTNNRMELTACIEALKSLKTCCEITIVTDSVYVKDGITKWVYGWRKRNWKTANGQEVKNKDLWKELYEHTLKHTIEWQWIKGHAGHPGNEKADFLANKGVTYQ